jgi:hypothetical protein
MRALTKSGLSGLTVAVAALASAACGGSSGPPTLNWYIFPEPSGSFAHAAKLCGQASGGKYQIGLNVLPTDADGQLSARTEGSRSAAGRRPSYGSRPSTGR